LIHLKIPSNHLVDEATQDKRNSDLQSRIRNLKTGVQRIIRNCSEM